MRSCLIATALARRLELAEQDVADTFYTALLMHVGCSSQSHETAGTARTRLAVLVTRPRHMAINGILVRPTEQVR